MIPVPAGTLLAFDSRGYKRDRGGKEVSLTEFCCSPLFRLLQLIQLLQLRQPPAAQTAFPMPQFDLGIPRAQKLSWNSLALLWNGMSPLSTSLWLYPLAIARKMFRSVLRDGMSLGQFSLTTQG